MPQQPSGPPGPVAPPEVAGGALTLIGRGAEIGKMYELIEAADSGGGVLVVRGDAGIGKSTLLRAAVDHARDRGFRLLSTVGAASQVVAIEFATIAAANNYWRG